MRRIWLGVIGLSVCISSGALVPAPAAATAYDFLAAGTRYTYTTYAGHSNYFAKSKRAIAYTVDIEMAEGTPIYAPEAGTVQQVSSGWGGGYGNAIIWTSADGDERIHVAHMRDVERRLSAESGAVPGPVVPVAPGDVIGHVGHTGQCTPADFSHMHMERALNGKVSPLVLSGLTVDPWGAPAVTSEGPRRPISGSPTLQRAEDVSPPVIRDGSGRAAAMGGSIAGSAESPSLTGSCPYCDVAVVSASFDSLLGVWQAPWPEQHDVGCPTRLGWPALLPGSPPLL